MIVSLAAFLPPVLAAIAPPDNSEEPHGR